MATDRVLESVIEDPISLSSLLPIEKEEQGGKHTNLRDDIAGFQALSMTMPWDIESISEVRKETRKFESASMVIKLVRRSDHYSYICNINSALKDAHGEIEIPPGVTIPEWLSLKKNKSNLGPPLVYIFNHEEFTGEFVGSREGSAKDVEALSKTFRQLNCQVQIVKDPKKVEVKEMINKLENENFGNLSALVVIILSHGAANELIAASDSEMYHLDKDVLHPLINNVSLRGKPKILIVQACKGGLRADAKPEEHGHYLKCYSTSEGYTAYRDPQGGSTYIQTLCKVMDQDALTKDFSEIIKDVNAKTKEESTRLNHKQVPTTDGKLEPFCFGDFVN